MFIDKELSVYYMSIRWWVTPPIRENVWLGRAPAAPSLSRGTSVDPGRSTMEERLRSTNLNSTHEVFVERFRDLFEKKKRSF